MKDQAKTLQKLRESIPEFECIQGCSQCCSHVPWSGYEFSLLSRKQREQHSIFSLACPYVTEAGCGVHSNRPITCRIFAVCEGMPCPRGAPAEDLLDESSVKKLIKTYQNTFFGGK